MLWPKIDLKQFVIISFTAHLCAMASFSLFHSREDKIVTIPLSYGLRPGTGGEGASRGRYLPAEARKSLHTPHVAVRKKTGFIHSDVTKTKLAAVVKGVPVTPSHESVQNENGGGSGEGNGSGEGIGHGTGGGENTLKARYFAAVSHLIEKNKFYPPVARRMGQAGKVSLRLTLDRSGKILGVEVLDGSPFGLLREASTKIIDQISTFPPIPHELKVEKLSFIVPIQYSLE